MKNILAAIAAIVSLALASVAIAAGVPQSTVQPDLSWLTSRANLRAYAVQQATVATGILSSRSQVGSQINNWSVNIPAVHSSADIFAVYTGQQRNITILNTQDVVYLDSWVTNSDGELLFWGSSSTKAVNGKGGGYYLPAMPLNLNMAGNVTVKFTKDVASAEVMYIDPTTGQTNSQQQLNVTGNKIYFPTGSAGMVFLVVNFTDGTQVSYDLRDSGAENDGTTLSQVTSSVSIADFVSYQNPTSVVDQIPSQNGIGTNRTYEIVLSGMSFVPFSVKTSEGFYPIGLWIQMAGDTTWSYLQWGSVQTSMLLQLKAGVWYVVPNWNPAQFSEPSPVQTVPVGGNG